jgi:CheY-like chemotaxis protein
MPHVLVVDDNDDFRDAICAFLRARGYGALAARDGQDALDLLFSAPTPAVIVLDLHMPHMTGWELLRVLRSYGRLERVPVVIVSASARVVSPHTIPTTILAKPFDAATLLEVVRRLAPGGP